MACQRIRPVAQRKGVDVERGANARKAGQGGQAGRPEGAVVVYADQLDGAVRIAGHYGVRVPVKGKGVDVRRVVEPDKGPVAVERRVRGLECAVVVYADQLDGVGCLGGGDGVRVAAVQGKGVDGLGAAERVKAARAVDGGVRGLEGAVVVDADQLDGVRGSGSDQGVRVAAVQGKGVDVDRLA